MKVGSLSVIHLDTSTDIFLMDRLLEIRNTRNTLFFHFFGVKKLPKFKHINSIYDTWFPTTTLQHLRMFQI